MQVLSPEGVVESLGPGLVFDGVFQVVVGTSNNDHDGNHGASRGKAVKVKLTQELLETWQKPNLGWGSRSEKDFMVR